MRDRRPRILLNGISGQVGGALLKTLPRVGEVIALDHQALNLMNDSTIRTVVRTVAPDVIVNAAAYTAVDRAELEREIAWQVNATAPAILAGEAVKLGASMVHFSTDYVFDGASSRPYRETDPTAPLGVYGESKLAGDLAVLASGASAWIFRVAWVYSASGKNFLKTIERLARENPTLRIVSDQYGTPTWAHEIAATVTKALEQIVVRRYPTDLATGVYHLAGPDSTSWYGFASAIVNGLYEGHDRAGPSVVPISTAEYPTEASRPAYSVLDSSKLQTVFGLEPRPWTKQLAECLTTMSPTP